MTATKQHKKVILVGDGAVGSSTLSPSLHKELHKNLVSLKFHNCLKKQLVMPKTLATPLPSLHLKKSTLLNTKTVLMLTLLLSQLVLLKNQVKLVLTL